MHNTTLQFSTRIPKRNQTVDFFLYFCAWFGLLYLVVMTPLLQDGLSFWVSSRLANASHALYGLFDKNTLVASQTLVHTDSLRYLLIDDSCSGLGACTGAIALIFAWRAKIWLKLQAAVISIAIIQGMNILRITHLFYLIGFDRQLFELYHLYIWQPINLVIVLGLFALFVRYTTGKAPGGAFSH